jgi:hypothetical protein
MIRTQSPKPKLHKCRICKDEFIKQRMGQRVCGPKCAGEFARIDREKKEADARRQSRIEDRQRKEEMQPRKWWKAKAKAALHAYIRARDEGKSCISCDTILVKLGRVGGDYDAGHFRSVGSAKHMEFVENNIHGQCKHCNDFLKGNQLEYERRLRIRKGDAFVDELLADNESRKLTIDDFKEIEATFKQKLKDLLASRAGLGEE